MTLTAFDLALPFVLEREGGYANNPKDPGGATMKGVTQRVYNGYRRRRGLAERPVKAISDLEIKDIYQAQYWIDGNCNRFAAERPLLALCHFDASVNCGIGQASKLLQRAVGANDDGVIGPKTIAAIMAKSDSEATAAYLDLRAKFYRKLVENKPALNEFLPGWLARLRHVARVTSIKPSPLYAKGAV